MGEWGQSTTEGDGSGWWWVVVVEVGGDDNDDVRDVDY
jgi:hypothetical protein